MTLDGQDFILWILASDCDNVSGHMNDETVKEKQAAGGVVIDRRTDPRRVLLVHRPAYDDWSFPKGGVKAGESLEEAALREVREETGLECRILMKLSISRYDYRSRKGNLRPKAVHYYLMEAAGGEMSTDGVEVDEACWLDLDKARRRLSYDQDRLLLDSVPG
jgi:8-oxo-dGTP diphosphatase